MATAKKKTSPASKKADKAKGESVAAYMASLQHPHKKEIEAVRQMILAADAKIGEGVKWNAPSFHVGGVHFATLHLRSPKSIRVVLHRDAKVRPGSVTVDDPAGLLQWPAKDRAIAELGLGPQVSARRAAFQAIVRAWIKQL